MVEFLKVEADRYTKTCQNSYLNPHPVPPRTIAARRIAPAMDPIMILVPLGPAQRKEGGRVRRRKRRSRNKTTPLKNTHQRTGAPYVNNVISEEERGGKGEYLKTERDGGKEEDTSKWGGGGKKGQVSQGVRGDTRQRQKERE